MTSHPYISLPDHAFWRRSIAEVSASDIDPVVRAPFKITKTDRIATGGSCFAQHIARHLVTSGFNFFITESVHPRAAHLGKDYNYGIYTARYGNIYTSRQLLQTILRAYGEFKPVDSHWQTEDGCFIDPFRPQIQPKGFSSLVELNEDRNQHFSAIRKAVEELDVFIFTLGLTESWASRADGSTYPLCPGVAGGQFDPALHVFVNLTVDDVVAEMSQAVEFIRTQNPRAKFILTVSPVPLIATMEDCSILSATTYSKSVLRVAADMVSKRHDGVAYFPSYEIITGNFSRGAYYSENLRDVTADGVAHVMRLFMKHYAIQMDVAGERPHEATEGVATESAEQLTHRLKEVADILCDEVALDPETRESPAIRQPPVAATEQRPQGSAMDYLRGNVDMPTPAQSGSVGWWQKLRRGRSNSVR